MTPGSGFKQQKVLLCRCYGPAHLLYPRSLFLECCYADLEAAEVERPNH